MSDGLDLADDGPTLIVVGYGLCVDPGRIEAVQVGAEGDSPVTNVVMHSGVIFHVHDDYDTVMGRIRGGSDPV